MKGKKPRRTLQWGSMFVTTSDPIRTCDLWAPKAGWTRHPALTVAGFATAYGILSPSSVSHKQPALLLDL